MNNNGNKFEENKNVKINEQENAQVENKSWFGNACGAIKNAATSKTGKYVGGAVIITAAGYSIWKWGVPAIKKVWPFGKKQQVEEEPATEEADKK